MLVQIPLLSFLVFGVTYPLFFWLNAKDPIKHNFHRFHLGCPVVIAGLAIIGLWGMPVPFALKAMGALWLCCGLLVTAMFWNKDTVGLGAVSVLSLGGLNLFACVYTELLGASIPGIIVTVLSGFIVSAIFYAMNLGHFYLNVHGLKLIHLKNSVVAFGILLTLRLLWNIYFMANESVVHNGEERGILSFMNSMDGFMLWTAFFFGTLFPLGSLYFALGTLKLKNTQATTGILYVLLSAVLLGDLAFKYYLFKFNIPM